MVRISLIWIWLQAQYGWIPTARPLSSVFALGPTRTMLSYFSLVLGEPKSNSEAE
jgi:hypothetical protein